MSHLEIEEALVAHATQKQVPLSATFELTPLCNMNCKMCYARLDAPGVKEQGGLASAKEWIAIAKSAVEQGTLFVLLTGGEPLLHPEFREIYIKLRKMGIIVSVNTNGTLIDEEWVEFFAENPPRKLNITLYGASNETYHKLCGYERGFDQTMNAVKMLLQKGVSVKFSGTLVKENEKEYPAMRKIADDLGVYMKVDSYIFPRSRMKSKEEIMDVRLSESHQGYYQFCEKKYSKNYVNYVKYAKLAHPFMDKSQEPGEPQEVECRAGRSSYWINWKLQLQPCAFMPEEVAWEAVDFAKAWKMCLDWVKQLRLYAGCANCYGKRFCNVCAAALYAETGEFLKKPDYLCEATKQYIAQLEKEELS